MTCLFSLIRVSLSATSKHGLEDAGWDRCDVPKIYVYQHRFESLATAVHRFRISPPGLEHIPSSVCKLQRDKSCARELLYTSCTGQ